MLASGGHLGSWPDPVLGRTQAAALQLSVPVTAVVSLPCRHACCVTHDAALTTGTPGMPGCQQVPGVLGAEYAETQHAYKPVSGLRQLLQM
jgi:hypothetical protein